MKNLFFVIFLLAGVTSLSAQWSIGPKSYLGVIAQAPSSIEVMPMSDYHVYGLEYAGSSPVTSVGFMMYNNIGPTFIQAELLGTAYRLDFLMSGYKKADSGTALYREQYYIVEIPINAGIRISDFKVGVGPVMELMLDRDSQMAEMDDYHDMTRKMDFSFQFMAGYNKGIMHIDIKYINKFSSITDDFRLGHDVLKYSKSANRLMFGIGISF